jgi:hypothetical protein
MEGDTMDACHITDPEAYEMPLSVFVIQFFELEMTYLFYCRSF